MFDLLQADVNFSRLIAETCVPVQSNEYVPSRQHAPDSGISSSLEDNRTHRGLSYLLIPWMVFGTYGLTLKIAI